MNILIGVVLLLTAVFAGGYFLYQYFFTAPQADFRILMGKQSGGLGLREGGFEVDMGLSPQQHAKNDVFGRAQGADDPETLERAMKQAKRTVGRSKKITLEEKYFQAGYFAVEDKARFQRMKTILIFVGPVVGALLGYFNMNSIDWLIIGGLLGLALGYQLPFSILDRKIKARQEDIMFFLPLVIEQISIGVSSSLDVGPCVERVVSMANERDTHNVVTELLQYVQFYVKSGVSFQDAMTEIGKLSGNTELKHAFMSISQVARHGGEISRQLQELADAVAMQRETKVEEKIKKLELAATGPVALVFVGFMVILLVGFGLQILKAFG